MNRCRDYTKGILQTIGFKEFIPYLEKYGRDEDERIINYFNKLKADPTNEAPESLTCLNTCLDELKLVTRRYSKKQIKWVKNRLLGNMKRSVPSIYGLDTSKPSEWDDIVLKPAIDVLQSFIDEKESTLKPLPKIITVREGMNEETSHFCEVCDRLFIGDYQWEMHFKSNKHKKRLASKNQKEKVDHQD